MTKRQTSPKRENMDGDSFGAWLWKVESEIRRQAARIRTDEAAWAVAAFNTNTDPVAAAIEWMRR